MPYGAPLTTQQKLSVIVVAVIGITTLMFGAFQVRRNIADPFARKGSVTLKTTEEIDAENQAALKTKDTDGDGLNDYDELYVFRTSPFLEDSDSDSHNDGVEVASANDPNCPVGRTCRQTGSPQVSSGGSLTEGSSTSSTTDGTGTTATSDHDAAVLEAMQRIFGDITDPTPEAMAARIQSLSSKDLRDFLVIIGIPESVLSQADDATLRSLLSDALTQTTTDPDVQKAAEEAANAEADAQADASANAETGN